MTYNLCTWRFIENRYLPIKTGFATRQEAAAALSKEWKRREQEGRYTDLGTFSIEEAE